MKLISLESAGLLLATALLVGAVGRRRITYLLVAASALFYGASAPQGLLWLSLSTLLVFAIGRLLPIVGGRAARWVVRATIVLLLGALILVKFPKSQLVVPLGISYFTFRLIAYILDVYWGRIEPTSNLSSFAAFVAFFPQISSGPIELWQNFNTQLRSFEAPSYDRLAAGMRLILFGLFEKMVVANRLDTLVAPVFDRPSAYGPLLSVLAAYAFPIQLYADFAGLTDIARGASRLLGFEAPQNFDRPFFSTSVREFWSRWHMSLTNWLRDYLFKPLTLALRRMGKAGLALAIVTNMLAVGLWHGLRWTFLVFGAVNALYVLVPALFRGRKTSAIPSQSRSRCTWLRAVWTFHLMMFAFVFFRAADLESAICVINGFSELLRGNWKSSGAAAPIIATPWGILVPVAMMSLVQFGVTRGYWIRWFQKPGTGTIGRWCVYYVALLAIIFLGIWDTTDFIYARF